MKFPRLHISRRHLGKRFLEWRRALAVIGVIFLVVTVPTVYFIMHRPNSAEAAWFDTNWGFRQRVPLTNSSGSDVTGYQVQITYDTSTPIAASKMLSTCNDIRFTDNTGKQLPYWIEPSTCNTTTTKIWIKVPSIPNGGGNIYIYYGNAAAAAPPWQTKDVFIRDMGSAAANWPLDDTTSTQTYSRVLNPSVSTGRNMVINGTFDTDTIWTKGTGWTIANGVASSDGTGTSATISQAIPLVIGKAYTVTYTVSGYTSGTIRAQVGSSGNGTNRTANGTFTETIVCSGSTTFLLQTNTAFVGSIDNVTVTQINLPASGSSVSQLLADGTMEAAGTNSWTAGNAATLTKPTGSAHGGTQVLRIARNGTNNPYAAQNGILTTGSVYRVTGYFRSDGNTTGSVGDTNNSSTLIGSATATAWQPFDITFVATNNNFRMQATTSTGTQFGEFDDVTVSPDTYIRSGEASQDGGLETWTDATTPTHWTKLSAGTSSVNQETSVIHGGASAVRFDVDASNSAAQISQNMLSIGKTYTVTFWAKSDAASGVTMSVTTASSGNLLLPSLTTTYTQYSVTFVAGDATLTLKRNTATSHSIYIDDVTVTEVNPLSGLPTNGVSLGQSAGGHLTNAYSFDGTNDNVNIYSSDLNSAFNPNEGTLVTWAKVSSTNIWTDGALRDIVNIQIDANNLIRLGRSTSNNGLTAIYIAGGTTSQIGGSTSGPSGWMQIAMTWSKSNDQVTMYVNGAQAGTTLTGLGTWSGNLASTTTVIGALSTTGTTSPWSGLINDVRLYSRPLTSSEIADMYATSPDRQTYYTDNYPGHDLIAQTSTSIAVSTPATEETGAGPSAYWKFDDGTGTTAKDSSPNSYTGTLSGTTKPSWQQEGLCISGKCLQFNGTTAYIDAGSSPGNYTNNFSISAWVRTGATAGRFVTRRIAGGVTQYDTYIAVASPPGAAGFYDGTNQFQGTTVLTDNKWHFVTFAINGANSKIYVDGNVERTFSPSITSQSTTKTLIGAFQGAGGVGAAANTFMNGFLDEVKIYPYVRTQAQVQADFLAGAGQAGSANTIGNNTQKFLSDGLVGYWKMDETNWLGVAGEVVDSSGNANNGAAFGTPPTTTTGKFGQAGNFNGTNDYVSVPNTNTLNFGTGDFSIGAWVKTTDTTNSTRVMTKRTSNALYQLTKNAAGLILFQISDASAVSTAIASTTNIADGNWHHVMGVRTGTNMSIYVDGKVESSAAYAGATPDNTGALTIGQFGNGTLFFNGQIDEVRIYDRSLSADEIRYLYNWAPGPLGWWKLDEGSGTTVNDSSGNGFNSTLWTGTQTWIAGKYGRAIKFNGGTSGRVLFGNTLIGGNFTLSAWVNFNSYKANGAIAGKCNNGTSANPFCLFSNATSIFATVGNGTTSNTVTLSTLPTAGQWHYVTFLANGTNLLLYIDGVQKASQAQTVTPSFTSGNGTFEITDAGGAGNTIDGSIDDVKLYSYARTPSQIVEDMQGAPNAIQLGGSSVAGKPSSPLIHWKFDDGYGTTAHDSGSANLPGTFTGTPTLPTWSTTTAKFGKALFFTAQTNTLGSAVASATTTVPNLGTTTGSQVTFTAWINPSASQTNAAQGFIMRNGQTTDANYSVILSTLSGGKYRLSFQWYDGTQFRSVPTTNFVITPGVWSHLGVVFTQGTNIKVYLNGNLIDTLAWVGANSVASASQFTIGSATSGLGSSYDGYIDEPKLFTGALTQDEIRQDMNATSAVSYGNGTVEGAEFTSGTGTNLIGDWEFEENTGTTANDTSGNGFAGTLTNGPTWTAGKYGAGIKFDGVNDNVNIYSSSFNSTINTNEGTIMAWAKLSNSSTWTDGSAHNIIAITTDNNNSVSLAKNVTNNQLLATYAAGGVQKIAGNSTISPSTDWFQIAITWSKTADQMKLYVNGVQSGATQTGLGTWTGSLLSTGVAIGASGSAGGQSWPGVIDQVKIYNYARTQDQIAYDYNRGAPVGLWKFNECQGTITGDSSGNNNNATINIGGTGTQTAAGNCSTMGTAWGNGATGKLNGSLNFDGTDDYVTMGDPASGVLDFGTGPMSVSLWVKTTQSPGANVSLLDKKIAGSNTAGYNFTMQSNGTLIFKISNGTTSAQKQTTAAINDGNWHLLTGTLVRSSTDAVNLYVDGNLIGTTIPAAPGWNIDSTQNLDIGKTNGNNGGYFQGQIDDIRIYNYALTQNQINRLLNGGVSVYYGPSTGSP